MSVSRQPRRAHAAPDPRAAQKSRTRRDLLAAARRLLEEGRVPSIAEVAEHAGVSRATAYRYFPTPEALVAEVGMTASAGPLALTAQEAQRVGDPVEHAGLLARHVAEWAMRHEGGLRAALRVSLDPDRGFRRPGHRREWIAELLAPLEGRVAPAELERLAAALTLVLGIDPIVCLRDIGGLEPARVADVLEWMARTLVAGVVEPGAVLTDG